MASTIDGGYSLVSLGTLCNLLAAVDSRRISEKSLRVFFAVLNAVASRQAAALSGSTAKNTTHNYSTKELAERAGLPLPQVESCLTQLEGAGLLQWSPKKITIVRQVQPYATETLTVTGAGSGRRLVPLPRRVIRFLMRGQASSVVRTMLAYMVRGLRRNREEGIKHKGAVKCSWIVKLTGLCLRSVKSARQVLIDLGWISKDTGSHQLKLNRTGAYFVINLNWCEDDEHISASRAALSCTAQEEKSSAFAPLPPENAPPLAPLIKQSTSLQEVKNQKPRTTKKQGDTVQNTKKQKIGSSGFSEEISFFDIKPEDITQVSRLLKLYQSAVRLGIVVQSRLSLLNFIAAAAKAKRIGRNPVAIFVWTVRNGFQYLADKDEIRAQEVLAGVRRKNQNQSYGRLTKPSQELNAFSHKQKETSKKVSGLIGALAQSLSDTHFPGTTKLVSPDIP